MSRVSKPNALVAVAGMAVAIGSVVYDHRHPPPSNHSIPVADGPGGACPAASPERDADCPYGPAPAAVDGIDYAAPFEAGRGRCVWIDRVRLPTGHLAAVDPLVFIDAAAPLEPAVAPGSYPVVLRVHQGDVALALLLIGGARPVRWAPARAAAHADPYDYGVDAGTGCYLDASTARLLRDRETAERKRRFALARLGESDPAKWSDAMDKIPTSPDLLTLMRGAGYEAARWVNVCVDQTSGGNMIAFHSGAGDGVYPVFVGTDAAGKVAAFVTDFKVIDSGSGRHPWIDGLDPGTGSARGNRR